MEELDFKYGLTKKQKIWNSFTFVYFILYGIFLMYREASEGKIGGFIFIAGGVFIAVAIIFFLLNTFKQPKSILKINNENVTANASGSKELTISWTSVSRVNIGPAYLRFLLDGEQRQQEVKLSDLMYKDVLKAKSKITELCEYKNIPYGND